MGGGGGSGPRTKKYIFAQGKIKWKNSCTPIILKKYLCYSLKEIHTRNLIKNSCGSKISLPPPPTTFLTVRPFPELLQEKAPWERGWEYLLMKEKDSKVACSRRFIALCRPHDLNAWKRLIPKQKHDRLQLCIKLSEVGSPTTWCTFLKLTSCQSLQGASAKPK